VMLGMEPKASHMLDKHFTTEQHPQPAHKFFLFFFKLNLSWTFFHASSIESKNDYIALTAYTTVCFNNPLLLTNLVVSHF
jgi:hypothetical protein